MPQCRVRVCLLHLIIVTSQLCNWYIISQRMFEVSSRFWFISQTLPGYLTATPHVILDGLGLLGTHCLSSPSLIEPSCCRAWTDGQDEDGSSWGKSLFSALCCRVPICLVRRKGSAGLLRKKKRRGGNLRAAQHAAAHISRIGQPQFILNSAAPLQATQQFRSSTITSNRERLCTQ